MSEAIKAAIEAKAQPQKHEVELSIDGMAYRAWSATMFASQRIAADPKEYRPRVLRESVEAADDLLRLLHAKPEEKAAPASMPSVPTYASTTQGDVVTAARHLCETEWAYTQGAGTVSANAFDRLRMLVDDLRPILAEIAEAEARDRFPALSELDESA